MASPGFLFRTLADPHAAAGADDNRAVAMHAKAAAADVWRRGDPQEIADAKAAPHRFRHNSRVSGWPLQAVSAAWAQLAVPYVNPNGGYPAQLRFAIDLPGLATPALALAGKAYVHNAMHLVWRSYFEAELTALAQAEELRLEKALVRDLTE